MGKGGVAEKVDNQPSGYRRGYGAAGNRTVVDGGPALHQNGQRSRLCIALQRYIGKGEVLHGGGIG